jgi:hypothetical protein
MKLRINTALAITANENNNKNNNIFYNDQYDIQNNEKIINIMPNNDKNINLLENNN